MQEFPPSFPITVGLEPIQARSSRHSNITIPSPVYRPRGDTARTPTKTTRWKRSSVPTRKSPPAATISSSVPPGLCGMAKRRMLWIPLIRNGTAARKSKPSGRTTDGSRRFAFPCRTWVYWVRRSDSPWRPISTATDTAGNRSPTWLGHPRANRAIFAPRISACCTLAPTSRKGDNRGWP